MQEKLNNKNNNLIKNKNTVYDKTKQKNQYIQSDL
jgi:hypothetical protein